MKEIQLTQGKVALVDDEDYEYLNQWKWCARKGKLGTFYAKRTVRNNITNTYKTIYMHRIILNITNRFIYVDHENHDGLDNQKSNIKACTPKENANNNRKHPLKIPYEVIIDI
jgi:hypothetical protein